MYFWGLHFGDWAVFLGFLTAIIVVGVRVSHSVKNQSDFYVGGRKLGRGLQFFLNFGNSTDSTGAVSTAREVYRQGAGGVWLSLQTLFITPFFWFTQVWYRRAREVTMADLFITRFNSKGLAFGYAAFNIFIALFTMGVGNVATYKAAAPMVVKTAAEYTEQERRVVEGYKEFQDLKTLRQKNPLTPEQQTRFDILDNMNRRGELESFISHIRPLPFYFAYSAVIALYIILGGLRAAAITDAIQGLLIIVMSVMLIPLGLRQIGGFSGLHAALDPNMFKLFGTPATSDYTWYSIFAIFLGSFIQIIGILHNMSSGGSAKNEDTARFGMISGGFTKRFVIIGWMFCALLAVGILQGNISDPDKAWGALSAKLLGPGLMGLMLSGMVLGHMPTVGVSAVAVSGLATRNVYAPLFPGKSQKHYLFVGQIAVGVILLLAIAFAMSATNLLTMVTGMITFNIYFGAAVFLIFFWRRLTWQAVMIGLFIWVIFVVMTPTYFVPMSVRRNPDLMVKTAQGTSVYFENVARINVSDPNSPMEGIGRLTIETYSLHRLGIPVEKFTSAGIVATRWLFDSLFPFLCLIFFSLITPHPDKVRNDRFYAKMKTPIADTPELDHDEVEKSYADPHRFDHKLFPGSNWEFCRWRKKDFIGFFGCWAIVGFILGFLYFVVSVGG